MEQIEKQNFKEEIDKSKLVNLETEPPKSPEKALIDTTISDSSASKSETTSDAPKIQKKKKTRCTKCKINVGCIGKFVDLVFRFFLVIFDYNFS